MAVIAPVEPETEWTEEQVRAVETALDDLNRAAVIIADRMERMHGLMQDIIGDLRAARTGTTQAADREIPTHAAA